MNIDKLNEAIGQIAFDLVEAADKAPKKTKVTWMKWAAAAVAIVVFAVGMPIALNMMGVFRSDNIVASGSDSGNSSSEEGNNGIVMPIGNSSSDIGGSDSSSATDSEAEPTSSSGAKPTQNVSPSQASDAPSGGESSSGTGSGQNASETPGDHTTPPDEPPAEPIEGEFIKDDMPAVTYRINGEEKTFNYQRSTYKKKTADMDIDGNDDSFVIDYYSDGKGNTVLRNGDSQELMQYGKELFFTYMDQDYRISEAEAIETARNVIMNTDLPIGTPENLLVAIRYSSSSYYVTFKTAEGNVEVILDKSGELQFISVKKSILQRLPSARVSAAVDKMEAKLAELNAGAPDERYVLDRIRFEEWGDVVYAVFDVIHYPDKNSDENSTYQYYCVV